MADFDKGRALDWNDEIEQESEFELLPAGEYDFRVAVMERSFFNGSEKMDPCNMARLTLQIASPTTGNSINVFDRLYLSSKAEWRISQFLICIGQKKKGEKIKPDWNAVEGSTGRAKIGIHKYNGKESNEVVQYLPKAQRTFTAGAF